MSVPVPFQSRATVSSHTAACARPLQWPGANFPAPAATEARFAAQQHLWLLFGTKANKISPGANQSHRPETLFLSATNSAFPISASHQKNSAQPKANTSSPGGSSTPSTPLDDFTWASRHWLLFEPRQCLPARKSQSSSILTVINNRTKRNPTRYGHSFPL